MAPVDLLGSAVWLVFLAVVVLVAAAVIGLVVKGRRGPGHFPYVKRAALFWLAGRSLLGVLEQPVSPEHRVFGARP